MTKNNTYSGAVQPSAFSIRSPDSGQRLQKIVPSIMQTSSEEKPMCTLPMPNSIFESATVKSTMPIVSDRRLELELNSFSSCVRI